MSKSKKAYLRIFQDSEGRLSVSINNYTASTLRALADEAEAAFLKAESISKAKPRAGFINLKPMHPAKIKEWDLPEGTHQLFVVSTDELEASKNRGGL